MVNIPPFYILECSKSTLEDLECSKSTLEDLECSKSYITSVLHIFCFHTILFLLIISFHFSLNNSFQHFVYRQV